MNTSSIPLFGLLAQKMSWLSARQNVIAQNIANADTPNYKARDIDPLDFAKMVSDAAKPVASNLTITDVRHFAITPTGGGSGYHEIETHDALGTPSGNAVSLEQEMIKLSDTQLQYQAATGVYAKAMNMFRTALAGRS